MIKYLPEFARKKRTPANGSTRLSAYGLVADEYRTHLLFQLLNLMRWWKNRTVCSRFLRFRSANPRIFAHAQQRSIVSGCTRL